MVARTRYLPLVAALALSVPAGQGRAASAAPAQFLTGPVLAGPSVYWTSGTPDAVQVERWGGGARLAMFRHVLRAREASGDSTFAVRSIAASSGVVAFRLEQTFCPDPVPIEGGFLSCGCTESSKLLVARPASRHFVVAPIRLDCGGSFLSGMTTSLAASGERLALTETSRPACTAAPERSRVLAWRFGDRAPAVLDDVPRSGDGRDFPSASGIAGRFVAWSERYGRRVVVYDTVERRVAYRVTLRYGVWAGAAAAGFDVASDGSLVVHGPRGLLWFGPDGQRWREVRLPGSPSNEWLGTPPPHLGGRRVAVLRYRANDVADLLIVGLDGTVRRVARFDRRQRLAGRFDFDGNRLTWASSRVLSTRKECWRECRTLESGVTTVWLLDGAPGAQPRAIATLPFRDAFAP